MSTSPSYRLARVTGEDEIDTLLDQVRASAAALANRTGDLSSMERISVEQASGSYLEALLDSYLGMPPEYRTTRELPTGGTAQDAMVRSLGLMAALLRRAEERVHGYSAATIAVAAAAMEQQYATAVAAGDIQALPEPEPEPDPSGPDGWRAVLGRTTFWPTPVLMVLLFLVGAVSFGTLAVVVVAAVRYPEFVIVPVVGASIIYFAAGRSR